jgi:PAS domain S-box-containing protein
MGQFENNDWNLLLDYTEDSLIIVGRDLRVVAYNKKFRDYYREFFKTDIIIGDEILNYAVSGQREALKELYDRIFDGQRFDYDIELPKLNGDLAYYQLVYKPAIDDAGNIIAALVFAKDVTKVTQAKTSIENSEKRFRALVENSGDAVAILAPDGKPSYVSPSISAVLGYTQEEALQLQLFDLLHPDDIEVVSQAMQKSLENPGKPVPGATSRIKHKDGTWRWLESTITNMIDDPLIGGIVDNFRDVTFKIEYEQQLKHDRNTLRAIIDNIPEYIYVKNIKGQHIVNNKKIYKDLLGAETEEETLGKTVFDYFGDILAADFQDDDIRIMSKGEPLLDQEESIIDQSGKKQWLSTTKIPIRDDDDSIYGLVGLSRNVTERYYRSIEESFRSGLLMSLSDQLQLNDSLVDALRHAATLTKAKVGEIWLMSRSKPILYKIAEWSSDDKYNNFLSLHGIIFHKGEGMPGMVWEQGETVRFDDLDDTTVFKHRELVRDAGLHYGVGVPIFNDGSLIGVMTLFSDNVEVDSNLRLQILERLCPYIGLEIARKRSQRDLDHFISKTPLIIALLGDDGYFKQVNPGLIQRSGYSEEELLSTPFIDFVHPDDIEITVREYERMVKGEEDLTAFINRYYTKSGSVMWTAWFTSPIPGEDGLYFAFGNDITELIESRERLEELNESLQERNKELALMNDELEQFVYIASHDLQEPLRMITSFLSLLEKRISDKLDDKSRQYINFAIDGAVRMRSLILDLLKYSRVGREVTLKEFVDLNALLKEVVNLNMPLLTDHKVNISIGNLPGVYGIKSALFQVFQNLIQNAVKYRKPDVTPTVSIVGEEFDTYWKFTVKDNGIGIEDRYFDKIFIIFQRLHTREEYSGTGIGLAICKKIVDHHKGKIWLESVVGEGSTFYFTIAKDQR